MSGVDYGAARTDGMDEDGRLESLDRRRLDADGRLGGLSLCLNDGYVREALFQSGKPHQ